MTLAWVISLLGEGGIVLLPVHEPAGEGSQLMTAIWTYTSICHQPFQCGAQNGLHSPDKH